MRHQSQGDKFYINFAYFVFLVTASNLALIEYKRTWILGNKCIYLHTEVKFINLKLGR